MIIELPDTFIAHLAQEVSRRIQSPSGKPWLTRAEAAERLCCSTRKLDQLVRLGEITAYRPAGRPLFKSEELDEFITNRREL